MPGERQYHGEVMPRRRKTTGYMHQRLQQADLFLHLVLAAQLEEEVIQPWLAITHQAGQGDGGAHIGEGVVGLAVVDAVGGGQALEAQRHAPFLGRPLDAFRAQGVGGTQGVDQVPAAVAALPLPRIGVVEVAVEAVAGHFVVEAQGVVAAPQVPGRDSSACTRVMNSPSSNPLSRRVCGSIPVTRQAAGWGRMSSLGRQ